MDGAANRPGDDFDDLLRGCLPALRRIVTRQGRGFPTIDAEDVLHDTVERALLHRDAFRTAPELLAWCATTSYRRYREICRSWDVGHHLPIADMTGVCDESGEFSPDPEELYLSAEVVAAVRAALAGLPARDRLLVEAASIRGLRTRDIAAELGLPVPAVATRLHRARERLRGLLRPLRNLTVLPGLVHRRGVHRPLSPARTPAPVLAASTAVVVTLSTVFPYGTPLRPPRAEAAPRPRSTVSDRPAPPRPGVPPAPPNPGRAHPPEPPSAGAPEVPAERNEQPPGPPICGLACLVPVPTKPAPAENGDEITVHLPPPVRDVTGPVVVRQNYLPVCDHWVDNPAASCRRRGHPTWVASPPPAPDPHIPPAP